MPSILSAGERLKRDRNDLGRILLALRRTKTGADQLLNEHVDMSGDEWLFKSGFEFQLGSFNLVCRSTARIVRSGGSALVLECGHREQPLLRFALKVPRFSTYASSGTMTEFEAQAEAIDLEYINHAPLSHKNIARLFIAHPLQMTAGISVTALLGEWIDGAKRFSTYLRDAHLSWPSVIDLLIQIFDGLDHVHSNDLVHWDMKSDNILVGSDGVPRVTDIGNARRLGGGSGKQAYSTLWNIPPDIIPPAARSSAGPLATRRTPITVPSDDWDSPWLDLWMLGRELNRLFAADRETLDLDAHKDLSFPDAQEYGEVREQFLGTAFPCGDAEAQYALRYVWLILRRLLAPTTPLQMRYYNAASEVVHDLSKLQREFGAAQNVPELQAIPQHVLRIPKSGNVPLSIRVKQFLNSRPVERLTHHLQLGVVRAVYPGATHCRSEHLFGVLAMVTHYVRALYADRTEPFWRLTIEQEDVDALLTAALLHDIGHVAFGHALEEMTGLLAGRMHEDYAVDLANGHAADGSPLSGPAKADRDAIEKWLIRDCRLKPESVAGFLEKVASILRPSTPVSLHPGAGSVLRPDDSERFKIDILHSMIDGPIDGDKLDYLLRDAHHCGVEYANGIDIDRFFQALTCIVRPPGRKGGQNHFTACIGITEKGILPAESILVARYQMFSSVYWHHTVRALDAMLQLVVETYVSAIGVDIDCTTNEQEEGNAARLVDARLVTLLEHFRTRTDAEALHWLRSEMSDRELPVSDTVRGTLQNACDSLLGNRDQLYRMYFELRYDRETESPDSQASGPTSVVLAGHFRSIADAIAKASTPLMYIRKVRELRHRFAGQLSAHLRDMPPKRRIEFSEGEILIDIAPYNKDRVEGVYVDMASNTRVIQEVSPVANAVGEAFHLWVRSVRVFICPAARDRCLQHGYSAKDIRDACREVASGVEQLRLEFEGREVSRATTGIQ